MEDSQKFMLLASKIKSLESKLSEATTKVSTVEKQIGPQGPRGDKGEPGKDGRDGRDGLPGADGKDGADGSDGVGIESVEVTFDNSLVVRLTDGTEIDAGEINVRGEGSSKDSFLTQYVTQTTSSFASIKTVTANYSAETIDSTLLVDATAGAVAVSLPATLDNKGRKISIKKIDTTKNTVSVIPLSGALVDGDTSKILTQPYVSITVHFNGENWYII